LQAFSHGPRQAPPWVDSRLDIVILAALLIVISDPPIGLLDCSAECQACVFFNVAKKIWNKPRFEVFATA
jgi:hypothetical protein